MHSVGQRVKRMRQEQHLSRERLAVRAGCSTSTLARLERHDSVPSLPILIRVADELGTTASDLLAESAA